MEHFRRARDAGLEVTVHAGEVAGPESVWSALTDLGATRIGHGIRSLEDPKLVDYLVEHRIGLEVNITSNIHIGAVDDYAEHPVGAILRAGILANLNTDDPAISGIDLPHEYRRAAPRAGLSAEETRQAQRNGLEMAFLADAEKQALIDRRKEDVSEHQAEID